MEFGEGDLLRAQLDNAVRALLFQCGQARTRLEVAQEDEALRFCRTLRARSSSLQTPDDVAGRVEAAAALWDVRERAGIDQEVRDSVQLGAEGTTERAYLEGLAALLRTADEETPPDYTSMPMSSWEGLTMYPSLFQFSYHLESGDYPDPSDGIRARIAGECSDLCRWELAPLIGEVHDALARFHGEETLRINFAPSMAWASATVLCEIGRLAAEHLAEHLPKAG